MKKLINVVWNSEKGEFVAPSSIGKNDGDFYMSPDGESVAGLIQCNFDEDYRGHANCQLIKTWGDSSLKQWIKQFKKHSDMVACFGFPLNIIKDEMEQRAVKAELLKDCEKYNL